MKTRSLKAHQPGRLTARWTYAPAALATVALVAACGGGGGGKGTESVNVSGLVVDGYIGGATVCMDVNYNSQCDADEPSTKTSTDGKYSFETSVNAAKAAPILVNVPVGASDSDAPDGKVTKAYTLASPGGEEYRTITPLTTLVHGALVSRAGGATDRLKDLNDTEREGLLTHAINDMKQAWGFKADDDIMADPVAHQGSNPRLRNLALAAASLLQAGHERAAKDAVGKDNPVIRSVLAVQMVYVPLANLANDASIAQINALVNGSTKQLLESEIQNIVAATDETLLQNRLMAERNIVLAGRVVNENLLLSWKDGRFTFQVWAGGISLPDGTTATGPSIYADEERVIADGKSPMYTYRYMGLGTQIPDWYSGTPSPIAEPYWAVVNGQWQKFDNFWGRVYKDMGNGVYDELAPHGDTSLQFRAQRQVHDISGLKMSLIMANNKVAADQFKDTDVFPAGSRAYSFSPRVRVQERLHGTDDTRGTDINSMWITAADGQRISSYAGIISAFAATGTRGLGNSPGGYPGSTGCMYFGPGTNTGALYLRGRDSDGKCRGKDVTPATTSPIKPHDGTWELVTRMGQEVMQLNWSKDTPVLSCNSSKPRCSGSDTLLVLIDGKIRYGLYQHANAVTSAGATASYFNRTALNAMLAKIPKTKPIPAAEDSGPLNVAGTWTGSATMQDGSTRQITAVLTQADGDTHPRGTISFFNNGTTLAHNGVFQGVVNDKAVGYRLTFATGSYPSSSTCQSVFTGNFSLHSSGQAGGSLSGSEKCGTSAATYWSSSNVTLTRQQ